MKTLYPLFRAKYLVHELKESIAMKKNRLFTAITVVFAFCSCNTYRYIYAASPANSPYFTKKEESRAAAYYSSSKGASQNIYAKGADLQGAYAVTNHVAVTAGYFGRREKDIFPSYYPLFDSSTVRYKRNLVDLGGGYFLPLDKGSTFSFYAGFATGKFLIDDHGMSKDSFGVDMPYARFHNSDIRKFYFQPAISFTPSAYFHFALVLKFSFVHYGNIQTTYTPAEISYFKFDRIRNKTFGITEPSFNFETGVPQVPWLKLTGNVSLASNPVQDRSTLRVRGGCFSAGLAFDPAKLKSRTGK